MKEMFVVQTFTRHKAARGTKIVPDPQLLCVSAEDAIERAKGFANTRNGVVALLQMYDEETGDISDVTVLAQHGEVPEDMFGAKD